MKIIKAGYQIMKPKYLDEPETVRELYRDLEDCARVCYKSENCITDESAEKMIRALIRSGHEAMLEHEHIRVKFIVDRGVSHEIVRHRIASFAQESTRYCNYSKDKFGNEITVIEPCWFADISEKTKEDIRTILRTMRYRDITWIKRPSMELQYAMWYEDCRDAEQAYFGLLEEGATPQEARAVLPTSLKTEVVMTANIREWRHFLMLRAAGMTGNPHPQMLEVAVPLLNELREKLPALFEDIRPMNIGA